MCKRHIKKLFYCQALLCLLVMTPALLFAGEAQPLAADPKIEQRVKEITKELRCLKCQNQTIAESKAGLADDLKEIVRNMVAEGKSEQEIKDYMVARYGDFVLYRPTVKPSTMPLWIGPFIFVIIGVIALYYIFRDRQKRLADDGSMSDAENERLQQLINADSEIDR